MKEELPTIFFFFSLLPTSQRVASYLQEGINVVLEERCTPFNILQFKVNLLHWGRIVFTLPLHFTVPALVILIFISASTEDQKGNNLHFWLKHNGGWIQ